MPEQAYIHHYNYVVMTGSLVTMLMLALPTLYYCASHTLLRSQHRRYMVALVVGLIGLACSLTTIVTLKPSGLRQSMHHEMQEYYWSGYMFNGFVWIMLTSPLTMLLVAACVYIWPSKYPQLHMYGYFFNVKEMRQRNRDERTSERNERFKVSI